MTRSFRSASFLLPALLAGLFLSSCDDSTVDPTPGDGDTLAVPAAYTFESRFQAGTSSVSYEGQVVRNLLIQDLKTVIDNLGKPGASPVTEAQLLKLYDHSDADNLLSLTTAGSTPVLEAQYNKISTGKKLTDKISGDMVAGTGKTADQLIRGWLQTIAANSQNSSKMGTTAVYIDDAGRNLSQMIQKLLHGSVAYYQGTGVYLQGLLTQDNTVAKPKTGGVDPFTAMEHSWDEAYGYYGAARDYARYTDAQLAGGAADYTFDTNGDGKIDLASEYNYTFARNAGKRDAGGGTDLTKTTFDAFLKGRTAITNKGTTEAITAHRTVVLNNWEKSIAATVVHYINQVKTAMAGLTETSTPANMPTLSNVWGEMKGFSMGLQYNPFKLISDAQLTQLHAALGEAPVFTVPADASHTAYVAKLDQAKGILKAAYGFTDAQMSSF